MTAIKAILIFLLVISTGITTLFYTFQVNEKNENKSLSIRKFFDYETADLLVTNTRLTVWIADTPSKRSEGLMDVSELPEDHGMLFVFNDTAPRTFWNQRTLLDLDIVWIKNNTIVGIHKLSRQIGTETIQVSSPEPVNYVLEVPEGWVEDNAIRIGDTIQ